MRFTTAWSHISSQNVTLKVVILSLSFCLIVSLIASIRLVLRPPLIIERGCYLKVASTASSEHTSAEIEGFIKTAISQRFDTATSPSPEFIAADELTFRQQEQQELASKNMTQRVLFNSLTINGSEVTVDSDRLISVGQVRSAMSFPLLLTISTTERTEANPYGLQLIRVQEIKRKNGAQ